MNSEKQIEKIAKVIRSGDDCLIPCCECAYYGYENCSSVRSARKLYDAGYRLASEVVREIFEEIEKKMVSILDIDLNLFSAIGRRTFVELKKKYEVT